VRRTLRSHAFAVVGAIVVLPLALVWLSNWGDRAVGESMALSVRLVAADAANAWRADPRPEAIERLAWVQRVRVRVVEADGAILADADGSGALIDRVAGRLFFGPDGAPSLAAWDAEQPPLTERSGIVAARETGTSHECTRAAGDRLLVCAAARRVTQPDGKVVVLEVEQGSGRAIRGLYDVRYQILKLTLYMLGIGTLLAVWLTQRMVGPIERLRDQVVARTAGIPAPIRHDREDEIGDLARAFNGLLTDLDGRNQAHAAAIADLAHELKNPVAAVRAAAEALDRPVDAERARRLGIVLGDSSRRLDALVTRFLELARAEAGFPGQERSAVDLDALIAGLVEVARVRWPEIAFSVEGAAGSLDAVPERIESALRNLVDNAASFAGAGGTVAIRAARDPEHVRIAVADTGPGIAPDDLPRVFERFFTRRPGGDGTGLGLALVRAIVVAHGGTVTVASEVGKGAVFSVCLPAVAGYVASPQRSPA
jgi:signal transduction histidine kinase